MKMHAATLLVLLLIAGFLYLAVSVASGLNNNCRDTGHGIPANCSNPFFK